ncbi:long-chain fatty acid transport protein [Crenobacter luteus]|uniref:OmpP1/FadL family transporter n=1 Tax=Crenobacter luteus TaxID=1452487 RepID=UPI0010EDE1E6|nr:OmpP1/FadL family transporter [Crenobacter luteus]TCP14776.1 long-chain fatty acid transport protein [Crenobacter luteus]
MSKRTMARHAILAAAAYGAAQAAWAAGYQLELQSIRAQGSSNAGSAEAADPSAIFYNPAGLTQLDSSQLTVGADIVVPHSAFSGSAATRNDIFGNSAPVSPAGGGGRYAKTAVAPHFYLAHRLNEQLTAGVGVYAPFGAKIKYDDDFAGRYYGSAIDLKSIAINPSIALKLSEQHSIGFGVTAQYMDAVLEKKLSFVSSEPDSRIRVTGDDWGYGFNLGYLFTPTSDTRIGVAYRSFIKHTLRGNARYSVPGTPVSQLVKGTGALDDSDSSVDLTTPETLTLHAYQQLDSRWAIMGDVTWSRHSRFQSLVIEMPTAQDPDRKATDKLEWKNSWRASLGASYRLDGQWTLRGGYMYDHSPVSDSRYAQPLMPDSDRQMLSLGASYRIDEHNTVDVAYSYLKFKEAAIDRSANNYDGSSTDRPGTLHGRYRSHANLLGIGLTHKF